MTATFLSEGRSFTFWEIMGPVLCLVLIMVWTSAKDGLAKCQGKEQRKRGPTPPEMRKLRLASPIRPQVVKGKKQGPTWSEAAQRALKALMVLGGTKEESKEKIEQVMKEAQGSKVQTQEIIREALKGGKQ